MTRQTIHVWITRYALSKGIIEADAELCDDISEKMIVVGKPGSYRESYHKPDWHTERSLALGRALEMVTARRKALKREAAKLDRLAKEYGEEQP